MPRPPHTGVVSVCQALGVSKKRVAAFYVQAALDLSTSMDLAVKMKMQPSSIAAQSRFLAEADLARPLEPAEPFPSIALRAIRSIAAFYGASIADSLAVSVRGLCWFAISCSWIQCVVQ